MLLLLQVIKMLIVVVTLFAVCWLPLHVFIVVLDFVPQLRSEDQPEASSIVIAVYTTVHWLAMSNSFVNPIVYGFLNDSFRVCNAVNMFCHDGLLLSGRLRSAFYCIL
jgi:leucokinin receptor